MVCRRQDLSGINNYQSPNHMKEANQRVCGGVLIAENRTLLPTIKFSGFNIIENDSESHAKVVSSYQIRTEIESEEFKFESQTQFSLLIQVFSIFAK